MENQKQNDDDGQTLVEQPVADAETAVTAVPGDSPAPTATATSSSSGEKTEEEIERRRKRKEAHRRHRRERELQKQIEAERLRINYLQDPRKRIGRDYEQWQAGQTVQTPEAQQKLTILRRIDDGHAGVVFKVRDEAGSMLALKVPRSESEKQFKKLHQEVAKNARMQSLGLPVAEITEEGGDYLVKRWIDGLRGDHWFIQWNEKGRPLDDLAWRRLCEMFDMLAAKNIYVQNLKDLNMIWDGQKWVVIDVGYFKGGLTPQQALGRYYETFDGRWNKPRYNRGRFMFLCPTIAALRGHSHPQHYIKRESARTAYQRGFTSKSKTSTAEGDASGSGELLLPRIDHTTNGGPMSPLLPGTKVGGLGASNGGSSEAMNDIKRKQAEAAMAVLERANRKKKKKQRQAAAAASGGGSKESDAVEGGAAAAATTTTTAAVTTTVKDESGEEKTKKRSAKDEEKEKKELKGKKEKELKEKKEKKEKELREKRDQKEKEKKEKEQKKKK